LQPETGDDLQWEKAGLLEVSDVIVIHKADLPGAERVEAQVLSALSLSPGPAPPVLRVSARQGEGVEALWQQIAGLPLRRGTGSVQDLLRLAQEMLVSRCSAAEAASRPELQQLLAQWHKGAMTSAQAAAALLQLLGS
jgi:putative protein kinase ArgK-like GTPase of G3E family